MELSADLRTELVRLFEEILATDERTVELPQATRIVGGCSRLQSVLAAREATFAPIMRRLEVQAAQTAHAPAGGDGAAEDAATGPGEGDRLELELGDEGGSVPPPSPPPSEPAPVVPRVSAREQRRRDARSRWLAAFELFAAALNAGRVSPEHADVLAAACERLEEWVLTELRLSEVRLVAAAESYAPEGFASTIADIVESIRDDRGQTLFQRQLAEARAWIRFDRASGLYHLHAILDPQRGELLQSALDQRVSELQADSANSGVPYGQLLLRALIDLVIGEASVTPKAVVVVDEQTARTGMQHPHTVCENIDGARLPIDLALAACVSGNVTAAIIDRAGKPADLSSSQPLANTEQRAELRGMYRQCVHPDCATPYSRCHQHHVVFREHRGRTTVSNMVPVCPGHHHDIHDRGWRLTIDAERTLHWYRPDGTLHAEVPQTRLDGRPTPARRAAVDHPAATVEGSVDRPRAPGPTGGAPPGRAPTGVAAEAPTGGAPPGHSPTAGTPPERAATGVPSEAPGSTADSAGAVASADPGPACAAEPASDHRAADPPLPEHRRGRAA